MMSKLAFITILLNGWLFTTASFSRTLQVGEGKSILTIQEGIELSQPGDTLLIGHGIYREGNIVLKKSITIIGEGYPVLDGEKKFEILTILVDNVVVHGLQFINTGFASMDDLAAIKGKDCKNLYILGNQFENNFFSIYLANSSHSRIERNQLHAVAHAENEIGNGIHMWRCDDITVNSNKIEGHRDGIYFEFVTNSLITNNISKGNLRYGLHFMFSHHDEYRNNIFQDNGAGVAVMFTKGVKMIDNTFDHNWGSSSYGLLLKEISDSFVSGNKFIQNSIGILMEGCSRIEFKENEFSRNGYAVRLQASCDDNVFQYNNFTANTFDLVTNGTLVLNIIDNNYWDKYEGYDLNKDSIGDVPYRPVSMYGMLVERMPTAVLLWRSFLVYLLDRAEKAIPAMIPVNLKDNFPSMKPYDLI
jgi:nitrous oxidase accessory protein